MVYVKGRQHPVTIYHTVNSQPDYVDAALRTFFQVHLDQGPGDVLIFLPGQEDIESCRGVRVSSQTRGMHEVAHTTDGPSGGLSVASQYPEHVLMEVGDEHLGHASSSVNETILRSPSVT